MSRFIAIDADAGGLFVAAGSARGGSVRVEQAAAAFDDPRPLSAATADDLGKRLKGLLAESRIPAAPALVCLGRDRVVFKDVRHPKTAPADEPAVVRFQSQRDLAESPDDLHMDYVPVPAPAGAEDARATVVFVRKDIFAAAKTMCEAAGLKLAGVTPRPFAAAAAVRHAIATSAVPPPDDPAGAVAVLSVWDGGGEFVVATRDQTLFTRTLPASALNSEQSLVGEAKRSLAAVGAQHPKAPVQAVYLAEGHTSGGSWAARLQVSLPVPVYPLDPVAGYADVPPPLRGRLVGPAGLLAARAAGNLPINFVTPRQPRGEPSKVRARGLLAAVAVLAVGGLVAGGAFLINRDLDAKIAKRNEAISDVEKDLAAQKTDTTRINAVEDFKSRDIVWVDELYHIATVYPDLKHMRLKEFRAEVEAPKPEARKAGVLAAKPTTPPTGGGTAAPAARPGAAVAAKQPEKKPAGKLTLRLWSTNYDYPRSLADALGKEPTSYQNPTPAYVQGSSGRGGEIQEFTVRADVFKRKPTEYTRQLTAKFPAQPPAKPATPAPADFDPDNQEQP